jgi:hypothetical protein
VEYWCPSFGLDFSTDGRWLTSVIAPVRFCRYPLSQPRQFEHDQKKIELATMDDETIERDWCHKMAIDDDCR